ncbi:DNA damage-inducible protein I [Enterobacter hormaechei]|uniref:DNA damage-inducible protein I n=1 Tax=Enterobacter hormaechei TaxID=158836 RepID=UPI0005DF5E25|nr:hypothetical protein BN1385_01636 [Enterobacter hormaechei]
MKVELTIESSTELPTDAVLTLEKELLKRLQNQLDNCSVVVCRAGSDRFSFFCAAK